MIDFLVLPKGREKKMTALLSSFFMEGGGGEEGEERGTHTDFEQDVLFPREGKEKRKGKIATVVRAYPFGKEKKKGKGFDPRCERAFFARARERGGGRKGPRIT